jgi:hypothetical protein
MTAKIQRCNTLGSSGQISAPSWLRNHSVACPWGRLGLRMSVELATESKRAKSSVTRCWDEMRQFAVVGVKLGDPEVGVLVGEDEGATEGCTETVGLTEGRSVGERVVGAVVGRKLGRVVGEAVGELVCPSVGAGVCSLTEGAVEMVGDAEGWAEGVGVGSLEGEAEGISVGYPVVLGTRVVGAKVGIVLGVMEGASVDGMLRSPILRIESSNP